ncbi:hypothetical protein GCM10010840_28400 [Deinococcus aerolatus]|uniref:GGDEF domain-containing protein n=2 Tax=Deinococcus aerolatus TaxID=522487 RepID=A0ABQ2GDC4_9DEIO|nr:hypothetical protein GCM10010840_28400 [Deinococcus aerolatus]
MTPSAASNRALRRVYLLMLGIVILALTMSTAARQQAGIPEFFVQVVTPPLIVVFGAVMVWLLLGRALRVAETVMVWAAGLASLANVTAFSVTQQPPTYYLNSGPYLSILVAFTFLLLIHTRPRTGHLALGLLAVSLALPWIFQNESVTGHPLDLLRLQVNITATAVMIYLLSWYRTQHLSSLQRQQLLAALAYSDPLTGLPNRRGLMVEAAGHSGQQDQPDALLLVDIDHFKVINDRHGHAVGDEVLILAAALLARVTGRQGTVGRWGGDEFLVLLPGMDAAAAQGHAERLVRTFQEQPWPHGLNITVSVGGAQLQTPGTHDADLARADAALYHAKALGRNRSAVFDQLDEQTRQQLLDGARSAPDLRPA